MGFILTEGEVKQIFKIIYSKTQSFLIFPSYAIIKEINLNWSMPKDLGIFLVG